SPRRSSSAASWRIAPSSRCSARACPSRMPRRTSSSWIGSELCCGRRRARADATAMNSARTAAPRATMTSTESVLAGRVTDMGIYLPERAEYTMLGPVDEATISTLLRRVADGERTVSEALSELRDLPFEDIGSAKIDHHRELRTGQAEAVYGPGKTAPEVRGAAAALVRQTAGAVFVTRATPEQFAAVVE